MATHSRCEQVSTSATARGNCTASSPSPAARCGTSFMIEALDSCDTRPVARPHAHALAIELTSHCNQRCSYCYNDWRADNGRSVGALASAELLPLLDRVLAEVEFDHVTLTGGEPLARNDFFKVMDTCRTRETSVFIIS